MQEEAMLFPDHFLSVRATVDAGREDEFNRWYNSQHVLDAVNMLPGCLGASRFKVMDGDGSHQYMALYAFRTAEELKAAIGSPEIKELIRKYDEAIGSFSTRTRTTYTQVFHYEKPSR
jgi:antibiotic biosynthesis monooxygenase (ABM) superfamily enzyme